MTLLLSLASAVPVALVACILAGQRLRTPHRIGTPCRRHPGHYEVGCAVCDSQRIGARWEWR